LDRQTQSILSRVFILIRTEVMAQNVLSMFLVTLALAFDL